jgi:antitoxin VapB
MMVAKSTIFKTNRSQAVRLPKEVAFPEGVKAVQISVVGNSRIITPAGSSWKEWFENGLRADFMSDREQPEDQEREPL